jgi:hypothetical protein
MPLVKIKIVCTLLNTGTVGLIFSGYILIRAVINSLTNSPGLSVNRVFNFHADLMSMIPGLI